MPINPTDKTMNKSQIVSTEDIWDVAVLTFSAAVKTAYWSIVTCLPVMIAWNVFAPAISSPPYFDSAGDLPVFSS